MIAEEKHQKTHIIIILVISTILTTSFLFINCSKDDTTEPENQPPNAPTNPSPSNGATDQSLSTTLSWECSDPDGDPLVYDIYFGTQQIPPLVSSGQTESSYQPSQIQYNSTYYWKIVAKDDHQHQTEGPVWSFSMATMEGVYRIGHYDTPGHAEAVFVAGSYAFVADGSSLQKINVSDPADPSYADSYNATNPGQTHTQDVYIYGDYAYLADDDALRILQHSDLSFVGEYDSSDDAVAVFALGNYAYLSESGSGVFILDIHEPTEPIAVGSLSVDEDANDVFVVDNYAYVADGIYNGGQASLKIFNVSNPSVDSLVGSENILGSAEGLFVSGNYTYVASGEAGLQIIDIANPSNPQLDGSYDTPHRAMDVYVLGDYAYVADRGAGLQIIDISNPSEPGIAGSYSTPDTALGVFVYAGNIYIAVQDSGLVILKFVP